MVKVQLWLGLLAALGLSACQAGPGPGIAAKAAVAGPAAGSGADWTGRGGGPDETAFSRLAEIDSGNAKRLGLAWSLDLPGETTLEATPIAVGGVVYFPGSHSAVYAVEGRTGRLLWRYDPQVWKHDPSRLTLNFAASRGVAYANGRIFDAVFDGRLVALDAKTGKVLWSSQTLAPGTAQWITGAPLAFNDKVIIGQAGADNGERGYVTAYDQQTGRQAWRFYPVPGSPDANRGDPLMERAAGTWWGEFWKGKTGGGPWGSIAFDAALNRVYIGSANPGQVDTTRVGKERGDQLFSSSIIALDADSGRYVWHYQVNPRDAWDYGANTQITLAEITLNGRPRKVLMQAPKNGFLYVVDRESGEFLSAGKIVRVTWAERIDPVSGRPVEAPNIRFEKGDVVIWPNPIGGHNWQAQAYSPQTGLIYIPAQHNGVRYSDKPIAGGVFINNMWIGSEKADERDGKGSLVAWDPVRQREAWRVMHANIWNGGVMASAGNLVFQGDAYGQFTAYDAGSGAVLWRFDAGLGIIGAPMSFAAGGRQYVAVLTGWGGGASIGSDVTNIGWKYGANPRRLLVFSLDGRAKLPPGPGRDLTLAVADDPETVIDAAKAEAGKPMFLACALCHGRDAISAGSPGPDLRESALALDQTAFLQVVKEGALLEKGMPRYDQFSREQVIAIWHYVRQQARAAKARQGG